MAAFCVETNDKTHVFAAERAVSMEWVEKMCEIAFQVRPAPLSVKACRVLTFFTYFVNVVSSHFLKSFFITTLS
jgi:hypothetical protein